MKEKKKEYFKHDWQNLSRPVAQTLTIDKSHSSGMEGGSFHPLNIFQRSPVKCQGHQ